MLGFSQLKKVKGEFGFQVGGPLLLLATLVARADALTLA